MDSYEFNKWAGAVLGSLLIVMVIGFVGNATIRSPHLEHPAYVVEGVEAKAETPGAAAAPAVLEPVGPLLAKASADAGQTVFKQCAACHNADKGGKNAIGPNLYDLVGRKAGAHEGFTYSAPMQATGAKGGDDGVWGYEHLNAFLANPKGVVPGTKMTFAGLRKAEDRANVIAFLRTRSDAPKPLP